MRIRRYTPADEPSWLRCRALSFLDTEYFDDVKQTKTTFDEGIELVAVVDRPDSLTTPDHEQVIGVIDVELWKDDDGTSLATIDTIAVHPDHRRSGAADALLGAALAQLPEHVATLDAWTRDDEAANGWYVRNGFHVSDEYLHVYADAEEAQGFTSPEKLSRPVKAFCHAKLSDEAELRNEYARVHRCKQYVRPVQIPLWTEDELAVSTYDEENGERDDLQFIAGVAERLGAERVTDLGCGTGLLAIDLAARGHRTTGIDPGKAILDVARSLPGSEPVTWIHGTAEDLPDNDADLVVMSAHVANYFLPDSLWRQTLADIARTLRPGGHLLFDAWNPAARVWEKWTRANTEQRLEDQDGQPVVTYSDVVAVHEASDGDALETHASRTYVGEELKSHAQETLHHRTLAKLTETLADAGFSITEQWGGFDAREVQERSVQFVILAKLG